MKQIRTSQRTLARPGTRTGAAIYTVVVFNALLVGLLGLSALSIVRIERRQSLASSDQLIARENAASAVAAALARIKNDLNWRTTFTHNTESTPINFSTGSATWRLVDLVDTSLSNNARHAVAVDGIGRCGNATWIERVEAYQPEVPLPTLACAIHSHGRLRVDSGRTLTVLDGVGSTNGELAVSGTLIGSAHCSTRASGGTVTGTVTTGMTARESPASTTLFNTYRDLAVNVAYVGGMNGHILGPGVNSYFGAPSADGIYYINTGSSTLSITSSRIHGTLIVKGNVTINDFVFLQFFKRESPVLIVDGNLTVQCDSAQFLSEAAELRNFNPTTAPFQGNSDLDTTDVYPSEIWGAVHVQGNLTINEPTRMVGVVLVDGEARISDDVTIQRDPTIFFSPPKGYWTAVPGPLEVKPTQWRRAAGQ
jgi:Tfp pilus assembly protein PilX